MAAVFTPHELTQAIATLQCPRPRCGASLFMRPVMADNGLVSHEFFELFDIGGHTFQYSMKTIPRPALEQLKKMLEKREGEI